MFTFESLLIRKRCTDLQLYSPVTTFGGYEASRTTHVSAMSSNKHELYVVLNAVLDSTQHT